MALPLFEIFPAELVYTEIFRRIDLASLVSLSFVSRSLRCTQKLKLALENILKPSNVYDSSKDHQRPCVKLLITCISHHYSSLLGVFLQEFCLLRHMTRLEITCVLAKALEGINWEAFNSLCKASYREPFLEPEFCDALGASGSIESLENMIKAQEIFEEVAATDLSSVGHGAARTGQLNVIDYLISKYPSDSLFEQLFLSACANGRLDSLRYIAPSIESRSDLFDHPDLRFCDIKTVEYYRSFVGEVAFDSLAQRMVFFWAKEGQLDLLKWYSGLNSKSLEFRDLALEALRGNQLETFEWAESFLPLPSPPPASPTAKAVATSKPNAGASLVPVIQLPPNTPDSPLFSPRIEQLPQRFRISPQSMFEACLAGANLQTILWVFDREPSLQSLKSKQFTKGALRRVASSGSPNEVISWVLDNYRTASSASPRTPRSINLVGTYIESRTPHNLSDPIILDRLHSIERLDDGKGMDAIRAAIRIADHCAVRWLLKKGVRPFLTDVADAIKTHSVEVVKALICGLNYEESKIDALAIDAICRGSLNVLEYFKREYWSKRKSPMNSVPFLTQCFTTLPIVTSQNLNLHGIEVVESFRWLLENKLLEPREILVKKANEVTVPRVVSRLVPMLVGYGCPTPFK